MYETHGGVLGSEEFVDSMIHPIGEFTPKGTRNTAQTEFDAEALIAAVERICGVARQEFCGKAKGARVIEAKETLILSGRRLGASTAALSILMGLDIANVSRRHDAGVRKMKEDPCLRATHSQVIDDYHRHVRESSISLARPPMFLLTLRESSISQARPKCFFP